MSDRTAYYSKHLRDPVAAAFYNSRAWRAKSHDYLTRHPICERCGKNIAQHCHHKIPFASCTPEQLYADDNLMAVDIACHNIIEARTEAPAPATAIGTLKLVEDENFYYDSDAADKPIRFIEKFASHYEGRFVGQPFKLLDWQKDVIIRPLFGWLNRSTGLRRFKELYLITAKGAGKTPLFAAIGLYCLIGEKEPGAHVISMASTFEQANYTFDYAKKYIDLHPTLKNHNDISVKQYIIEAPLYSKWTTVSGKPNGRSGGKPSVILASEPHEWSAPTAKAFDMLCANLFKRRNPLLLIDTNAGENRQGIAWRLHERASGVLTGAVDEPTLLPVIYEAPKELDWRSEDAARAANPSIPDIVSFDSIKGQQNNGEAKYRRLFLSQWVTASDKWINVPEKWEPCVKPLDPAAIKDLPRYVGIDLSGGDDLCAMVDVYPTEAMYHISSRFWLPQVTADKYEARELHPYNQWALEGAIELLKEPTISIAVQQRIAQTIIDSHKVLPITAVCYDRAYSSGVIPLIQAAGINCEKVGQGWGVSEGCKELDRRLIEKSITIAPNSVLKFCAENVEIFTDKHGNYWPVKHGASHKNPGIRSCKIDGISALVTAITEARKHAFAKPTAYVGAWAFNLDEKEPVVNRAKVTKEII